MNEQPETFWVIGELSARSNRPNLMKIVAVANSKKLAEKKRDQTFSGKLVAKLLPSEADRILSENDRCFMYTEFPTPIMGAVDLCRSAATMQSGKCVSDTSVLLDLI
ncbi:MAG: hypothetical protein JRN21_09805 [Nitrososphaerota archaeon]|nr:hypothetical protein [Nitrososphaerota archaeon]